MNIIQDLKKFIVELVAKSFFFTKLTNPKEISDPIIKKLDDLKPHSPTETTTPIVQGLKAVQTAIESREETDIRPQLALLGTILREEIGKLDREVIVKNDLSQLLGLFKTNGDKKDIVEALKSIEKLIPKIKEVPDYTMLLSDIITAVEQVDFKVDLSVIEGILRELKPFELPEKLIENERIKVVLSDDQLSKIKGSTTKSMGRSVAYETVWQKNVAGSRINPMTEETGQALLAASGGSTFNYVQNATTATYKYYGFASSTGWRIKRKTLATGVFEIAEGTGDYDTAWADRENKSFNYTI